MNDDKLFDVLEKLIDELEFVCDEKSNDTYYQDLKKYLFETRQEVFSNTKGSGLTFSVQKRDDK